MHHSRILNEVWEFSASSLWGKLWQRVVRAQLVLQSFHVAKVQSVAMGLVSLRMLSKHCHHCFDEEVAVCTEEKTSMSRKDENTMWLNLIPNSMGFFYSMTMTQISQTSVVALTVASSTLLMQYYSIAVLQPCIYKAQFGSRPKLHTLCVTQPVCRWILWVLVASSAFPSLFFWHGDWLDIP